MKAIKFSLVAFIVWRVWLFVFSQFSLFFEHTKDFLGGGIGNYVKQPLFWGWANYDGEHYISIARWGYRSLEHFFYPLYPSLISEITNLFSSRIESYALTGLVLSHTALIGALFGLYKLVQIDFSDSIAEQTIILLLLFPGSLFFAAVYTESLFLFFAVWAFYFARKKNFLIAGIFAALAMATRSVGIVLIPALIFEAFDQEKHVSKRFIIKSLFSLVTLLGLFWYMTIVQRLTGSYFGFNQSGEIFGAYREGGFTLLPQVYFRYYVRILPSLNYSHLPTMIPSILELASALFVSSISLIGVLYLRKSYLAYMVGAFLLSASFLNFNSQLRFTIVLFPLFIVLSLLLAQFKRVYTIIYIMISALFLLVTTIMFLRGFWLA